MSKEAIRRMIPEPMRDQSTIGAAGEGKKVRVFDVRDPYKNIKDHPILTADQEVQLAKRYEAAVTTVQVARGKLDENKVSLSPIDKERLVEEIAAGEKQARETRNTFVEHNMRLVVSVANRFGGRGVEFDDLMMVGTEGVIRAVEKFDYTKGVKFSVYATQWVENKMLEEIADQSGAVRVPKNPFYERGNVMKAKKDLWESLGRRPTNEEIAKASHINSTKVEELLDSMSLHQPNSWDVYQEYQTVPVARENTEDMALGVETDVMSENRRQVNALLGAVKLSKREQELVELGIDTPSSVAASVLDVSKDTAWKIKKRALEKLRGAATELGM